MNVREKLVELIFDSLCRHIEKSCKLAENIADDLISNGVTVQSDKDINAQSKWIPVTEKLPDKDGDYLVFKKFAGNAWSDVVSFAKDGRKVGECAFEGKWQNVWYYYDSEWGYIRTDAITHWMPLPQPPKISNHGKFIKERTSD